MSPHAPERPHVDAIAIGASAGGLGPLRAIVAGLPADLPAALLVVLHVPATGTSVLPQILARASDLEVRAARDGDALRPGCVLVAPADRHLLVEDGVVCLDAGPRVNGHRPAIDPLMRSLAAARGEHAAGLVLSGSRDDGTVGLAEVKRAGGVALVQDPEEAEYPSMPASALAATEVDAVLEAAALPAALTALARGVPLPAVAPRARGDRRGFAAGGAPLTITCPDCGGVLTEHDEAGVVQFRCHVGHAYSPRSLVALHAESVERAMWTAARSLEDRSTLLLALAERARAGGNARTAEQFALRARRAAGEARTVRSAIGALVDDFDAGGGSAP